jgi:hypothetical protein
MQTAPRSNPEASRPNPGTNGGLGRSDGSGPSSAGEDGSGPSASGPDLTINRQGGSTKIPSKETRVGGSEGGAGGGRSLIGVTGGGGSTHSAVPFGTDADFGLLILGIAALAVSGHLFHLTWKLYDWLFAGEKHAPQGYLGSGICAGSVVVIGVVCALRSLAMAGNVSLFWAVVFQPRSLTLGLFGMSAVFSAVGLTKIIGLLGMSIAPQEQEQHRGAVGITIGTGLFNLVSLISSLITIGTFVWPPTK